jgi:cytochrome P450
VFFFAGTDTTSHLVEMMIYYTANNEYILKKVREEIESFKG